MFIRQTQTRSSSSGGSYLTHRLVQSIRAGRKVSQHTLLNLGTSFDLPREAWPELCTRIEQILDSQEPLFAVDPTIEQSAQSIYSQIIARRGELHKQGSRSQENQHFEEVDINSLQQIKPRSVGAEHVSLEALKELQIPEILEQAGFNGRQRAEALANIIARMCAPRSELATAAWLKEKSALGELLKHDFTPMLPMALYRASDRLFKKKNLIEAKIFERVQDIFNFIPTVTLYDLTNTYMEGNASANPKAKRGRSKEKRSDCPLLTLGLTLDASGFIRHSKVFEGNVSEGGTLKEMLRQLQAPDGALVIMDAGIASEENLQWLTANNYNYLVVSRERKHDIDMKQTSAIESATGHRIHLQRQPGEHQGEIKLACWSEQRAMKDQGIDENFRKKYEAELRKISEGLGKPGFTKKRDALNQRIGRLKEKCKRVSAHYSIEMKTDEATDHVTSLTWEYQPQPASKQTHPGVYKLRTTLTDWSDENLWRTYTMLTDLESVFRSLKSELGMRPVYHHKEERCDGHLFITVLAYQAVQVIRKKLKEHGINESWASLRETLSQQSRITATFKQRDGRTLHIRQATRPEETLSNLYSKLGIDPAPGGLQKMVIEQNTQNVVPEGI
jgi:transposase